MSEFEVVSDLPANAEGLDENEDNRTFIQKMFFDFDDKSGELKPLQIIKIKGDDDYKRHNDAIIYMTEFKKDDPEEKSQLKGKDILIFGGRRRGRAGTGVELMLPVEDINDFAGLMTKVANTVLKNK